MIPFWARDALANLLVPRNILASQLEVTSVAVTIEGLAPELDGFTIGHISDLHVGEAKHWVPPWTGHAAAVIRGANVDVVVNTGDFVWKEPLEAKAREFASQFVLHKPGIDSRQVSIAILGNHDYYTPARNRYALIDELEASGISVLINEGVCVSYGSHGVSFVGVSDEEDSFERGVNALLESAHPRIALVHMPDLVERIPRGAADLVLTGHTHGGQFTLPRLERLIVRRGCGSRYVEGFYTINDMPVYVNRGLGYTGFPVRYRARPEVALIRLVR